MEDDNTDPRYVIQRRHIWLMEPCECTRVCSCPSDGRLTYKRDVNYDCTVIEGTRVAQQSLESVKNYISKKSPGAVIAIMTVCDDNNSFWLASLQSKVFPAPKSDSNTGVKKGELVVKVIWFDKCDDHSLKYVRLDDLVTLSISSVVVTKSNITWQRTTTNRYYLGEHTHNTLVELVEQMSLV